MIAENGLPCNTMDHSIDISIVVPFYKGEKFFTRLAESIVASYHASACKFFVELIVIVDSVESEVGQISSMLNHITGASHNIFPKIIKNELNLGVAQSRMTGYQLSTGKFITFIDQDDYVGISYFSILEQHLTGDFDFFLMNGFIEFEKQKIHRPVFYCRTKLTFNKIARVNFLITPGLLVYNRAKTNCEFRQMSVKHPGSDDWACYLELLSNPSLRYKYISEKIIHYVIHDTNYHQDKYNFIISQIRTIQYYQKKYPKNAAVKIKVASLQFRLKRHLSMIRLSTLTMKEITGFIAFIFIELFSIHNLIWLIWRKRLAMYNYHKT